MALYHQAVELRFGQPVRLRGDGLDRAAHIAEMVGALGTLALLQVAAAIFQPGILVLQLLDLGFGLFDLFLKRSPVFL